MRRRDFIALVGGTAAAWPLAGRAQQKTLPVIGFMSSRSPEDSQSVLAGFRKGLSESGLVEGKDVVMEFRWARGDFGRLPALAAELVRDRVAVIVAAGRSLRPWRQRPRPQPYRLCLSVVIRLRLGWSRA